MPIPCDCCPTGPPRCALVAVRFTGVAQTVAEAGWNPVDLALTIDGVTATTALSGYNSPAVNAPSTILRVTYTHTTPQNRVRGLRLWNQAGGDHGDNDGLGVFTAEFYSGTTLLTSLTMSGANGGQAQTFTLPGDLELSSVTSVVLRDMGKRSASSVAPLWRELQLVEVQTVFPCRRTAGALEWYDAAGNVVPAPDVIPCPEPAAPLIVPDLTVQGAAFNFPADGSGAGEGMRLNPPAASVSTGTAEASPGLYVPSAASPTTPCGGRRMDETFPPGSSFDFEYTNVGASGGGVFIQLAAPSLGGALNFGPFTVGTFLPGQSRTISVPGGQATLTYLSGPSNANAPQSSGATCGLTSSGSSLIALHFGNTSTADFPIRFNVAFTAN